MTVNLGVSVSTLVVCGCMRFKPPLGSLAVKARGRLATFGQNDLATLLALADEMREVRTICHCGRKATMVVRRDAQGRAFREGPQVEIGGNERYESLCRLHYREAVGDR